MARAPLAFPAPTLISRLTLSLLVLPICSCSTVHKIAAKYPAPKLETLYETRRAERNPLVLLPGFAGSVVRSTLGDIVWGGIHTGGIMSYGRAEGLRALALPFSERIASLSPEAAAGELYRLQDDDAVAKSIMAHFHTAVVLSVEFPIYAGLLKSLAHAGYRLEPTSLASDLGVPANPDGVPCFVFAFDWRLDIAGLAGELDRFLDQSQARVRADRARRGADDADGPVRFDVLAHSMGSLVARYYLRHGARDVVMDEDPEINWAGSDRIARLVMLSPPNRGSMQALVDAVHGADEPFMPPFQPAMVTTWISVPQMFPRVEAGWLRDARGRAVDVDLFDIGLWRDNGWGPFRKDQRKTIVRLFPGVPDARERTRRLEASFEASLLRAKRFVRLIDRVPASPPPRTTLHLIAADTEPTLAGGRLVEKKGRLELEFSDPAVREPGDSSITRWSALGDLRMAGSTERLRSTVPWDSVMFLGDTHGGLLSNRVFHDNLLYLLLESSSVRRQSTQNQ